MPRDWRLRIMDILDAIHKIERYTSELTFDDFQHDEKTIDAVIRNFQVIGEAARYIPNSIEQKYSNVAWDEMRGMRNVIIHEYFGIDHTIIWQTVVGNLPPIVPLLDNILRQEPLS